jgi:uncharacterized RDD family membrane protein YckC
MSEQEKYVVFAPQSYASTLRRVIIAIIDVALLFTALWGTGFVLARKYVPQDVINMPPSAQKQRLINQHMKPVQMPAVGGWLLFCAVYHIGLRRFRTGTLGYLIAGTRIVDATGNVPSWKQLGKRFVLGVPFVGFFGMAYLTCGQNARRQAFHDRWSGTWVVRRSAQPDGAAKPAFQTKLLGPMLLTYLDLEPLESSGG